ncbi:RDD family protein [Roseinatronobacter alkalisoli]|uniref:RDD family protein n=1 Tax=Roseinatronobacter alkalisoli TaxID=3028235 RepID=A0ABT5T3J2_9RHOB|nr:RDD family protein [Roseinatronobacter sp. HJB301]MDD7969690.1 RDD family protein [Roseinatronobacter sp. HJB301]
MTLPDPELQPEFYADVPLKRVGAWAIDLVVTALLTLIGLVMTLFISVFFLPVLFATASIAYRTVMLARYGATLGMMGTALKWRSLDGRNPDAMTAFWYSVMHAGMWTVFPLQAASMVMILLTPYRQGLHDFVLNTTMLHRIAPQ